MTGLKVMHALWESSEEDGNNSSGSDTDEERCHFKQRKDPAENELHAYVNFLRVYCNFVNSPLHLKIINARCVEAWPVF